MVNTANLIEYYAQYNCGGFALKKREWITPYDNTGDNDSSWDVVARTHFISNLIKENVGRERLLSLVLARDTNYLLTTYPELELVNLHDCKKNDRVIAYRLGFSKNQQYFNAVDCDFHFRVRIRGHWYEKYGQEAPRRCSEYVYETWESDDAWDDLCDLAYDSPIVFFRYKELAK